MPHIRVCGKFVSVFWHSVSTFFTAAIYWESGYSFYLLVLVFELVFLSSIVGAVCCSDDLIDNVFFKVFIRLRFCLLMFQMKIDVGV